MNHKNQGHTVLVAYNNKAGVPDMMTCIVDADDDDVEQGFHYEMAMKQAVAAGQEGPFVCFGEADRIRITALLGLPASTDCAIISAQPRYYRSHH